MQRSVTLASSGQLPVGSRDALGARMCPGAAPQHPLTTAASPEEVCGSHGSADDVA